MVRSRGMRLPHRSTPVSLRQRRLVRASRGITRVFTPPPHAAVTPTRVRARAPASRSRALRSSWCLGSGTGCTLPRRPRTPPRTSAPRRMPARTTCRRAVLRTERVRCARGAAQRGVAAIARALDAVVAARVVGHGRHAAARRVAALSRAVDPVRAEGVVGSERAAARRIAGVYRAGDAVVTQRVVGRLHAAHREAAARARAFDRVLRTCPVIGLERAPGRVGREWEASLESGVSATRANMRSIVAPDASHRRPASPDPKDPQNCDDAGSRGLSMDLGTSQLHD